MSPTDFQHHFNTAVHEIYSVYPSLTPEETYLSPHWPTLGLHLSDILKLEDEYNKSAVLAPTEEFATILCTATWFLFETNALAKVTSLLPTLHVVTLATRPGNDFIVAQMYRLHLNMSLANREYKTVLNYAHLMLDTLKRITPRDEFILAERAGLRGWLHRGFLF